MTTWAIVVAAGGGSRFGGAEQFARLGDATVLDRSVAVAQDSCDGVVVVLAADASGRAAWRQNGCGWRTRSESVRAGARPKCRPMPTSSSFTPRDPSRPPKLYERVVHAVEEGADGAVPAVAVSDTVKRVDGDRGRGDGVA